MRAVLTQVRAAVLSRRAQTAIVLLISLLAGTVAAMALTLLVRSSQPWDDAFTELDGAHLVFHLDASRVTRERLEATESLPGVTAAGPPRGSVVVPIVRGGDKSSLQVIERAGPGGRFDRVALVAGRWAQRAGEIVVTRVGASDAGAPRLGDVVRVLSTGDRPAFTVVGEAIDVTEGLYVNGYGVRPAWVVPGQVAALADGDQFRLGYEMAYRFQLAATAQDVAADRREIEAALPAGSETQLANDWITSRTGDVFFISLVSSAVGSFTVFALFAVAMIVASVVAGSVVSSYREIGILKALGFTPSGVAAVFIGQMTAPALLGAAIGTPVGALASRPFLKDAAAGLALPEPAFFDPYVASAVVIAVPVLVACAAFVPAIRAARANSARAIMLGSTPRTARRSHLAELLARLGAPRPISLGAGEAFARPVRAAFTLTAIAIGVATVTFAGGFQQALTGVVDDRASYGAAHDVEVNRYPALSDRDLMNLLQAQPETRVVVATRQFSISVPGEADPVQMIAMRGDATLLGYRAANGRWFSAPGEAVIGQVIAREAHLGPGDSLSGTVEGRHLVMRIVGIMVDISNDGRALRIGWDTLAALAPGTAPSDYLIGLRPASDAKAYAKRITSAETDFLRAMPVERDYADYYSGILRGLIGGLALVLTLIAAAGVFNAALLSTRERVRDIAVLKSLGIGPGQIGTMIGAFASVLVVVAALIGVPLGFWLMRVIFGVMADAIGIVADTSQSFAPLTVLLSVVGAFAIALTGAVLPARWAAATAAAEVLRSE